MALFAAALSRMRGNTARPGRQAVLRARQRADGREHLRLGGQVPLRLLAAGDRHPLALQDKQINSWLGPGKGYGKVPGQNWQPYQALNVVTPAFPEYVSGHSTFSAAGRTGPNSVLRHDNFNAKVTIKAGTSKIESGRAAKDVVLSWKTLTAAADQAGMSRRYGGIHFESGDQHGRALGESSATTTGPRRRRTSTAPRDWRRPTLVRRVPMTAVKPITGSARRPERARHAVPPSRPSTGGPRDCG